MGAPDKNPWKEFKTVGSSRPKSRNTPGMLLLAMIFAGCIGFGVGAVTTAVVMKKEADERHLVRGRKSVTWGEEYFKWFVLAGGLCGAGSFMGGVWKFWPKDLG